jgi:hypothetical protein
MKSDSGANRRRAQDASEQAWWSEYRAYEADREFGRMRRRAILCTLACRLARRRAAVVEPPTEGGAGSGLLVDIRSIIGSIDREGREVPGLPVLKRVSLPEWRRIYLIDSDDAHPALTVRQGRDGWYLAGGLPALIVLEVSRAKKRPRVRIALDPRGDSGPCPDASTAEGGDECHAA